MTDTISFTVPLPPRGLRRNSETRVHGYRAKLRREYSNNVGVHFTMQHTRWPEGLPWERVALKLTWRSVRPPDKDNVVNNCKALIDILRCQQPSDSRDPERYWLGLFRDDAPECLVSVEADSVKLPAGSEDGVLVELRRVEE